MKGHLSEWSRCMDCADPQEAVSDFCNSQWKFLETKKETWYCVRNEKFSFFQSLKSGFHFPLFFNDLGRNFPLFNTLAPEKKVKTSYKRWLQETGGNDFLWRRVQSSKSWKKKKKRLIFTLYTSALHTETHGVRNTFFKVMNSQCCK